MTAETKILLALLVPSLGALLISLSGRRPNLREAVTLITAVLLFGDVLLLLPEIAAGSRPSLTLTQIQIFPSVPIRFEVEPLGMMFAVIASGLWIVNSLYSIGYMRGNQEQNQTRFYVCFATALASTMGVAFAGNMLTLFIFYEALTLSTYPLVTHKGNEEAKAGGRVYLGILLATSIGLLLLGMLATWNIAGTLDFLPGGILEGKASGPLLGLLLFLYMFGIGKAALMPIHRWLPSAMVAPTPVSALLHAVAVVKAGVFTVLKVTVYIFGVDFLGRSGLGDWVAYVAAATILLASLVAMTKDNLKARLAYSTVSQLSYVVLGAMLASTLGVIGGGMHIAMHAVGKITLFFCAGAIYVATHKTEISEMAGIGRSMPITMSAFFLGSLSIIGLPPFGGAWSKWYLALGAAETGHTLLVAVLMISSLLNVAYLMPIVARAFFLPPPESASSAAVGIREAPMFCVVPLSITALGCLALFFYADSVYDFLTLLVTPQG
ncbi:MAG: monovalent cation/H+ antiporter subunit D family protein [Kiloniellales bacterium]|nr:monovalent cation/H+ antiporter subunit D family protein [Kiloniellales bacterium]